MSHGDASVIASPEESVDGLSGDDGEDEDDGGQQGEGEARV